MYAPTALHLVESVPKTPQAESPILLLHLPPLLALSLKAAAMTFSTATTSRRMITSYQTATSERKQTFAAMQ
jgi:hypothetical protein